MRMYHLFKTYGVNLSPKESQHRFNQYIELYKNNWTAFEDVNYTLQTLQEKGHSLGIISNGEYEQQVEKLTALNILQYFKYIFTSSELGISKPNPEIFQRTVLQLNLEMKDCYYIGDRLETDAISSTAAGMQGIWLNRDNSQLKYNIPTICSLHEVLTMIKRRPRSPQSSFSCYAVIQASLAGFLRHSCNFSFQLVRSYLFCCNFS